MEVEYGGSNSDHAKPKPNINRARCFIIIGLVALCFAFLCAFVMIATLLTRPSPSTTFTLNDVKLYALNVSTATSTLTSNLQITLSCKNTEEDGFHFDKIDVYASYRGQKITLPTTIPPTYMGESDVTVWSPYLNGTEVPVPSSLASSLIQDETAGMVLVNVMFSGRVRWMRSSVTVRTRLEVNCPAYVMFGNSNDTNVVGSVVKRPFDDEGCHEV